MAINLFLYISYYTKKGWIVFKVTSIVHSLEDHFFFFFNGNLNLIYVCRAYVERCNKPAVHRLITFGSPHGGTYGKMAQCTPVQAKK